MDQAEVTERLAEMSLSEIETRIKDRLCRRINLLIHEERSALMLDGATDDLIAIYDTIALSASALFTQKDDINASPQD